MTWNPIPSGTVKHHPAQPKRKGLDWSKHTQPKLPGTESIITPRERHLAEADEQADRIERELNHRGGPKRRLSKSESNSGIWAISHGKVIYLFTEAHWSATKIAKVIGCRPAHVRRILDRWDIPR